MNNTEQHQKDISELRSFLVSALGKAMPYHEYKSAAVALVPLLKSPQATRLEK